MSDLQFVSECVPLCLQSPVDFIKKVVHEALMNNKQISLMVNVLKHFKWICNVHAFEEEESPLTLVTDLLDKKINENLTDTERPNLPKFVSNLYLCHHHLEFSYQFILSSGHIPGINLR